MARRVLVLVAICLAALIAPPPVDAMTGYAGDESNGWCCETYPNSRIVNFVGYGDACADWGTGCTECVDTGAGDSCITASTYCSAMRPLDRH